MPGACGTEAGYHRHRYHQEPSCADCLAAHARYRSDHRKPRKTRVQTDRREDRWARDRIARIAFLRAEGIIA